MLVFLGRATIDPRTCEMYQVRYVRDHPSQEFSAPATLYAGTDSPALRACNVKYADPATMSRSDKEISGTIDRIDSARDLFQFWRESFERASKQPAPAKSSHEPRSNCSSPVSFLAEGLG